MVSKISVINTNTKNTTTALLKDKFAKSFIFYYLTRFFQQNNILM